MSPRLRIYRSRCKLFRVEPTKVDFNRVAAGLSDGGWRERVSLSNFQPRMDIPWSLGWDSSSGMNKYLKETVLYQDGLLLKHRVCFRSLWRPSLAAVRGRVKTANSRQHRESYLCFSTRIRWGSNRVQFDELLWFRASSAPFSSYSRGSERVSAQFTDVSCDFEAIKSEREREQYKNLCIYLQI